jgi:serine/threonine-protein kinase
MIGQKLGNRYEVIRELGRGGMGVVYLARDAMLERDVAVKLIGAGELSSEARARFLREARVVAKMDHPGIVAVHDIGEQGEALFLVMAFVPGSNLRELFERGDSLRLDELMDLGIQASEALEHAHSLGVVHRDIKPENIMVVRKAGEGMRVLLADFGLATALSEQRLTRPGAVMGTVAYMSPEQVAGGAVDARTDVYALGTVLYECLAGDVPFPGVDIASTLYRVAHQAPPPLRRVAPHVDADLEAIVMRCLEKDPARRPQRPRDLGEALQRYRASLTAARASSSARMAGHALPVHLQATVLANDADARTLKIRRKVRLRLAIGGGIAIAAAAGLVVVALHGWREPASTARSVLEGAVPAMRSAAPPVETRVAAPPASTPLTSTLPTTCDRYCDVIMKNCTGPNAEYLSREICMKMCPAFEIGVTAGDTANATLGCRLYHASAAEAAPSDHCRAAGALGGRHCGKDPCEPFCALAVTYCAPPKAVPYPGGISDCRAACKSYPYLVGDAGDTTLESGNTLNCRLWHLETAYTSDEFGMFHCPHTRRVSSTCF